jgi:nucleoside-diphosphate-sugar epimerase
MLAGDRIAPVREAARSLTRSAIGDDDRVLVTGAGGWFGSTVAALLRGVDAMYVTRSPRRLDAGDTVVTARGWDLADVIAYSPTIVVDCAFVLRDYAAQVGIERYVYENTMLTQRLLRLAQLPSVRRVISVSSGAAVHPVDGTLADVEKHPYEYLKRQAELAVVAAVDPGRTTVVVARPWGLSGSLIQRPQRYAFADLILQARGGRMEIRADHEVWRRYAGVDDFFAVCFAASATGPATIDSGGDLVEVGDLAARICETLDIHAEVRRVAAGDGPADDYYSSGADWLDWCARLGFVPADLDEQIRAVDRYLQAAR